jgi:hypothetical protein
MWADKMWRQTLRAVKHQSKDHDLFSQVPAHTKKELTAETVASTLGARIIRIYKCPEMSISKPLIQRLYFSHKRPIKLSTTRTWVKECFSIKHQLNYLVLG